MLRSLSRLAVAVSLVASSLLPGACSPPPPKHLKPPSPLPEGRAHRVILQALQKEGLQGDAGKDVMASGTHLHVDVIVTGTHAAIAYLTDNDLADPAAASLPAKDPKRPNSLVIAEGGGDFAGMKIVLLFAHDYTADDEYGEDAEHSTQSAEASLTRDVRDFLYVSKSQGWR